MRARLPLAPGHVRRLSPTVCAVEPFPGSSDDDRTQLQWLARAYARRVPFGGDWPVQHWAQEIGFHDGDHAGRVWLLAYVRRFGAVDSAKKLPYTGFPVDGNLTVH